MTKKTLAFVVYPGVSLLELVSNRTEPLSIIPKRPLPTSHSQTASS
jgi:hypothetical protein